MQFTSWQFAVFVCVVFALYYVPAVQRFQVLILVAASLFFYAWDQWRLLLLLVVATVGTYACLGPSIRGSRAALWVGIIFNLSLLAFFKYKLLFLTPGQTVYTGNSLVDTLLLLPLPIGISFFVFHNI